MPTGTTGSPTTGDKWKPGPWILGTGAVMGVCFALGRIFGGLGGAVDVNHHIDGGADLDHNVKGKVEAEVSGSLEAEVEVRADTASWKEVCRECQEQQKSSNHGKKNRVVRKSAQRNGVNININNNNGEGTQDVCDGPCNGSDNSGINININNNNGSGNQNVGCDRNAPVEPKIVKARGGFTFWHEPCQSR